MNKSTSTFFQLKEFFVDLPVRIEGTDIMAALKRHWLFLSSVAPLHFSRKDFWDHATYGGFVRVQTITRYCDLEFEIVGRHILGICRILAIFVNIIP